MKSDLASNIRWWDKMGMTLAIASIFLLIFALERGGPIDCNFEDTPKMEVSGDLYFSVINHYKSADYIVKIGNPSKPITGYISCRGAGVCGILMDGKKWPTFAHLKLNQCRYRSEGNLFQISEIEAAGMKRSFSESVAYQKRGFHGALALILGFWLYAIACLILFIRRIRS